MALVQAPEFVRPLELVPSHTLRVQTVFVCPLILGLGFADNQKAKDKKERFLDIALSVVFDS